MSIHEIVRDIKTIGDGYPIYQEAEISIREFSPDEVRPTSKYVLWENLRSVNRIRKEAGEQGVNILQLDDITEINGIIIAPPVVENDGEEDCIVDGLHRFTIARVKGEKVKAIYISGVNQERPIIGKPVSWDRVIWRRKKPDEAGELRDLRVADTSEELRKCYRDLSVLGSNGRRPRKKQNG
jgi:hypothetical protein